MGLNFQFSEPQYFYLLLLIPLFLFWYWFRNRKIQPELQFSSLEGFGKIKKTFKERFRHILFTLRLLAFIMLIFALARPQSSSSKQDISIEGIDIILALDISTSMLAEDFKPNRIEAAKSAAISFIKARPNDRIGLVVFSGESFTQCPLTSDHDILINLFDNIKSGIIEDGTAIGNGLATSISRIKNSKAKSKVIILLTDGVNNAGEVDPYTSSDIAKLFNIRIYSIGVGTQGLAPYPFQTPFGIQYQQIEVEIDEKLLQSVSTTTGGKYYRATDNRSLSQIYEEIDKMEKTKIDVTTFRKKSEEFFPFAIAATILLLLEFFLRIFYFRTIP